MDDCIFGYVEHSCGIVQASKVCVEKSCAVKENKDKKLSSDYNYGT